MIVIQQVEFFQYGPDILNLPVPVATSVAPNHGLQGTTISVTVSGSSLLFANTFDFGTGITVSSVVIPNSTKATMTLTISASASLGFRTLTTTGTAGSSTLTHAFKVQPPIFRFPMSGLDPNDMAILGNTGTQTLYWDYSNTQDFYIQVAAGQFDLTAPTLFAVSPLFASNWFGNQAPAVTYDPFTYNNPTNPSTFSDI